MPSLALCRSKRAIRALLAALLLSAAPAAPALAQPAPPAKGASWWAEVNRLHAEGNARVQRGELDAGIALLEKALALSEEAKNDAYVALTLRFLIHPSTVRRDPAKVEALHLRIIALEEKAGAKGPGLGMALNDLGELYRQMGELSRAQPLFERAITLYEAAGAAGALGAAAPMNNLAVLHMSRRDYPRAQALLEKALALQEAALGKDSPMVASTAASLAVIAHHRGDHDRAIAEGRRACAILERALSPDHYAIPQCWSNLGAVLQSKGDLAGARVQIERSMAARTRILGARHPRVAESHNMMGQLHEATGDPKRALESLSLGCEINDEDLDHILVAGSERQKKEFTGKLAAQLEGVISLQMGAARKDPAAARLALRTVLRRKGRVLDAVTEGGAALRRRMSDADRKLLGELAVARRQLAELVLGGPRAAGEAFVKAVTDAEEKVDRLEAQVSDRSAASRGPARRVTVEAVQAAIPPGATLVELVRYRPFDVRWRTYEEAWKPARYAAYALAGTGEPAAIDLGDARSIEDLVAGLRRALGDRTSPDAKALARRLDERVMAPIAKVLVGKTVLLSADGALHLVPFGALVDESGKHRLETLSFTHLGSGRDLLRLGAAPASAGAPLVLANPSFGPAPPPAPEASRLAVSMRFPELPGTADEAASIARLLPGATLATEAMATEALIKGAEAPAVLHVATHGFFLGDPAASLGDTRGYDLEGAAVASGGGGAARTPTVPIEQPLLRSGLALAGANQRASGAQGDDGLLTALEAAGLDLSGTQLVVLSACETGVGDVQAGEGVYGLRRALAIAGAESQVMSLWKVDDEATRDLMVAYYGKLVGGGERSGALREAQLAMLAGARSHPYYWAAFIASGDWRPLTLPPAPPAPSTKGAPAGRAAGRPPSVEPGARGCGCDLAGDPRVAPAWVAAAIGLAALRRSRRRSRERGALHGFAKPPPPPR